MRIAGPPTSLTKGVADGYDVYWTHGHAHGSHATYLGSLLETIVGAEGEACRSERRRPRPSSQLDSEAIFGEGSELASWSRFRGRRRAATGLCDVAVTWRRQLGTWEQPGLSSFGEGGSRASLGEGGSRASLGEGSSRASLGEGGSRDCLHLEKEAAGLHLEKEAAGLHLEKEAAGNLGAAGNRLGLNRGSPGTRPSKVVKMS